MKKRLLLKLAAATSTATAIAASSSAAAAATIGPLHASLESEPSELPPRGRRIDADDNGDRRRRQRRRRRRRGRRRQLLLDSVASKGLEGASSRSRLLPHELKDGGGRRRQRRRSLESLAEKFLEFEIGKKKSSPAPIEVRYDPASQLPLPPDFLPNISSAGKNNANGNDDEDESSREDGNNSVSSSSSSSSKSQIPILPRIINGIPTSPSRYPYAASLMDTASLSHICGGTLIAPDIVLTAGHCSGYFDSIQVGRHDIVNQMSGFDHLIVEEHRKHPGYGNVIMNDYAVAKLYGLSTVDPVRINNRRNVPAVDEGLEVMGWGVTQEGVSQTASDVLTSVAVRSMSNGECEESSGIYEGETVGYAGYIVDNMMCAFAPGRDACQGDSGGPLIKTGGDAGEDVQVGVVSWGLGCALDAFPGVYARISSEYDWIRSSVCEMSADPPAYLGCKETTLGVANVVDSIWTRTPMTAVTIAIELDENPQDTGYVLEEDPGLRDKTASEGRSANIEGLTQAPFDTFTRAGGIARRTVQVAPNEQYRLTLLDRGTDGLRTRQNRQSRFRMCYGNVSGPACINAGLDSDLVICSGNGNFDLAKSITCFVDQQETYPPTAVPTNSPIFDPLTIVKPPTFAPFDVPLLFYGDDDRIRPTPRPTRTPTASPTIKKTPVPIAMVEERPSLETFFVAGTSAPTKEVPTAFLSGTTLTQFVLPEDQLPITLTMESASIDDMRDDSSPTPNAIEDVSNDSEDEESSEDTVSNDVPVIFSAENSSAKRIAYFATMATVAISSTYFAILA